MSGTYCAKIASTVGAENEAAPKQIDWTSATLCFLPKDKDELMARVVMNPDGAYHPDWRVAPSGLNCAWQVPHLQSIGLQQMQEKRKFHLG